MIGNVTHALSRFGNGICAVLLLVFLGAALASLFKDD